MLPDAQDLAGANGFLLRLRRRKSRLKVGCRQDCLPHRTSRLYAMNGQSPGFSFAGGKHAAIDDGKNIDDQPPLDAPLGWECRSRKVTELLDSGGR